MVRLNVFFFKPLLRPVASLHSARLCTSQKTSLAGDSSTTSIVVFGEAPDGPKSHEVTLEHAKEITATFKSEKTHLFVPVLRMRLPFMHGQPTLIRMKHYLSTIKYLC